MFDIVFDIVFGVCSMESKATFSSGKIESVFRPVPNIARLMGAILLGSNRIPLHLINNLKTFETNEMNRNPEKTPVFTFSSHFSCRTSGGNWKICRSFYTGLSR